MEKARALAEHVSQFMKWKDMECPYEKNSRILDYFERSAAYSSDALEMESFLCEPPDTPQDKDQYKSLKHGGKKSWKDHAHTKKWQKLLIYVVTIIISIINPRSLLLKYKCRHTQWWISPSNLYHIKYFLLFLRLYTVQFCCDLYTLCTKWTLFGDCQGYWTIFKFRGSVHHTPQSYQWKFTLESFPTTIVWLSPTGKGQQWQKVYSWKRKSFCPALKL